MDLKKARIEACAELLGSFSDEDLEALAALCDLNFKFKVVKQQPCPWCFRYPYPQHDCIPWNPSMVAAAYGCAPTEDTYEFDVVCTQVTNKVTVLTMCRKLPEFRDLSLKDLVVNGLDKLPWVVMKRLHKGDAEELKNKLEQAGAKVELRFS